jgi:hypothetical protein
VTDQKSPFQPPTRLADGLGFESNRDVSLFIVCPMLRLTPEITGSPASGLRPELGCTGLIAETHWNVNESARCGIYYIDYQIVVFKFGFLAMKESAI